MQCRPVRHTIPAGAIRHEHDLDLRVIRRDTEFDANVLPRETSIQGIDGALAVDDGRLRLIVTDALDLLSHGRAVMILTERRDHLERLAEAFRDDVRILSCSMATFRSEPDAMRDAVSPSFPKPSQDSYSPPAATSSEGFDDPRLDTLLLTMPIAWNARPADRQVDARLEGPSRRSALSLAGAETSMPSCTTISPMTFQRGLDASVARAGVGMRDAARPSSVAVPRWAPSSRHRSRSPSLTGFAKLPRPAIRSERSIPSSTRTTTCAAGRAAAG